MDCKTSCSLIHGYLDGDLSADEQRELRDHFNACSSCYEHFRELDRTVTALEADRLVAAPLDFTEKLRQRLPVQRPRRMASLGRQLRRHPFLVAASVFLILMSASIVTAWNKPEEFTMTTAPHNLDSIVIDAETRAVRVPEGQTVEGDLIVQGGKVEVHGEVTGNVVAVDGEVVLASTANIYGKKEEIDQVFDWIWFKSQRLFDNILNIGNDKGTE